MIKLILFGILKGIGILLLVLLALGNATFLVTDFLLTALDKRYFHRKKA